MKKYTFPSITILTLVMTTLFLSKSLHAQSHLYGTPVDEYFTRAIPYAQGIYVLGQQNNAGSITHLDLNGNWQWTHETTSASQLTDGIVLPNGNLLFIGMTLPLNSSNQSIVGEITPGGSLSCFNLLDQPGAEGLNRIDFNGSSYTAVGFYTDPATFRDVLLVDISTPCTILRVRKYISPSTDGFAMDIAINGNELYVAGSLNNRATLFHHLHSNNAFVNGVQMPSNYTYADLEEHGTDMLAIANPTGSGQPHVMRFDVNLFVQWEVDIFGVSSLHQVIQFGGDIFLLGTGTVAGQSRSVIIKMDDSSGPQLVWAKYFDDGETGYLAGGLHILPGGNILYADGRQHPSGYGMFDGFVSITDNDATSMCTASVTLDMSFESTPFESPEEILLFPYEFPVITSEQDQVIAYEYKGICGTGMPTDSCICAEPELVLNHDGTDYFLECLPHGTPTPVLSCPVGPVSISGFFGCEDQNTGELCDEETPVHWILSGPGGAIDGGTASNFSTFLFPASYFLQNGLYTLTLSTWCPGAIDSCVCVLDWIVECGTCCPPGNFLGSELVLNGDFESGLAGFSSLYTILNPTCSPGKYNVADAVNVGFMCNDWACNDHTTGLPLAQFFVADGSQNSSIPAWRELVHIDPSRAYAFCAWANNLYVPSYNGGDPIVNVYLVDPLGVPTLIATSGAIPESPDQWINISANWTSPGGIGFNTPYWLEIRSGSTVFDGNNFALDDISFRTCSPTPIDSCCADYDAFCQYVMNALTITENARKCKIILNIDNLPSCYTISQINWGDSSTDPGPFGNGSMTMHTYSSGGTYLISYLALATDPNTGLICFEKQFYDTLTIDCRPCDTLTLPVGLTGHFPFDDLPASVTTPDLSTTGIPGALTNVTLTSGHDNAPNSAYTFNGSSSLINCGIHDRNIRQAVTVAAWVRTNEMTNGQWIAGKYSFPADRGYHLTIGDNQNNNIGKVAFSGRDNTGIYHSSGLSPNTINDGEWHCVVGTAGNNTWNVYVDGTLQNSAPGSTNNLSPLLEPFTIGWHTNTNFPFWMNGDIDNVLVYDRVLTDDEIECLCEGIVPEIQTCACDSMETPSVNLVTNGDFSLGDAFFTSGLIGPGSGNPCVCSANTYCVESNFNMKCGTWPPQFDHTQMNASGSFLIVDGSETATPNIWSQQVNVVPGMTYEFSFWTANVYPANLQNFNLDIVISGIGNPSSHVIGTAQVSQTNPAWEEHCFQWTCPGGFIGPYTLSINQLVPNQYTDFGIDDICFSKIPMPDSSCCINEDNFNSLVTQGFAVYQNGCAVTVCTNQFDTCHYFGSAPYFGDGIPVPLVTTPANGCWSYTYSQSGTYTICVTVYEDTCWQKQMCVPVHVRCDPEECACPEDKLIGNSGFEIGPVGFPNGPDQINPCVDWQESNNLSGVTSIGDWYSIANPVFPGLYYDGATQSYIPLNPHCDFKYGGVDLSTCEGISAVFANPILPGQQYTVDFYWSPREPITVPFSFHAIVSNQNCNVNHASGVCTHQCNGDFHIVVNATPSHIPGNWYLHSASGIAPTVSSSPTYTFNDITFAGLLGQPPVDNYIYIDDVCVTAMPADTCECVDADNLSFIDAVGEHATLPFNSPPVRLECDTSNSGIFYFHGDVHCSSQNCLQNDFGWMITDLDGFIVRGGTTALSSNDGKDGHFDITGMYNDYIPGVVYTITVTSYCGTKACPFSVQFSIACDSCYCGSLTNLNWRPAQGAQNQLLSCGDSLVVPCPNPGYNIPISGDFNCLGDSCTNTQIQWFLKKSGTNQIVASGTEFQTTGFLILLPGTLFSNPGTYELTITGICNGKKCEPCTIILTSAGCPCTCNKFEKLKLVNKKLGINQSMSCDTSAIYALTCPPMGKPYKINGKLSCSPSGCSGNNIHWEFKQGSTVIHSGNQSGPWFNLTMDQNFLAGLNGTYDLVLTGNCGNDVCTCVIHFDIAGCPAPPSCVCDMDFYANANWLNWLYVYPQGMCGVKFNPTLTACDSVHWEIDGLNTGFHYEGASKGDQAHTVLFPVNSIDIYKITYHVFRPGTTCTATTCFYIQFNCLITGNTGPCEMNLIDNGGFSHGTMPGIMGHEGRTEGWTNRSGLPELIPDECGDPYAVLLHGLCSPIDIDIIDHRVEITGDMNGLSFNSCYQLTEENWRPGTQLVLRLADEPQETGICQGECSELGRLQLDPTPSGEWNTASGSFLLDGLTGQKYLTLHIENDLADPENENSALVQLDNICLEMNESDTVGVQTEYAPIVPFTIYPNPNRGDFTVELTDVVQRPMSVQIVSLIGEVIAQQSLTSGKRKHHIQLGDVPAGLYFFQIQSNGQTLNSGKFVKQ